MMGRCSSGLLIVQNLAIAFKNRESLGIPLTNTQQRDFALRMANLKTLQLRPGFCKSLVAVHSNKTFTETWASTLPKIVVYLHIEAITILQMLPMWEQCGSWAMMRDPVDAVSSWLLHLTDHSIRSFLL